MSAGDLWRCPHCKEEKRTDDSDGLGPTYSVQCGCGTDMELVELAPAPHVGVRPAKAQRSCSKAREQYWAKKLGEAAAEPSMQERFLNWCGAGGGI